MSLEPRYLTVQGCLKLTPQLHVHNWTGSPLDRTRSLAKGYLNVSSWSDLNDKRPHKFEQSRAHMTGGIVLSSWLIAGKQHSFAIHNLKHASRPLQGILLMATHGQAIVGMRATRRATLAYRSVQPKCIQFPTDGHTQGQPSLLNQGAFYSILIQTLGGR